MSLRAAPPRLTGSPSAALASRRTSARPPAEWGGRAVELNLRGRLRALGPRPYWGVGGALVSGGVVAGIVVEAPPLDIPPLDIPPFDIPEPPRSAGICE